MTEVDILATLLSDNVKFSEALLSFPGVENFQLWPHQIVSMRDKSKNIIYQCGRDIGKTIELCCSCLSTAISNPGCSGLVGAAFDGQLRLIISLIEYQIDHNALIAGCIKSIVRAPYYEITFYTAGDPFTLYFRPAGQRGEAFRAPHVDYIWIDEGAYIPELGWQAFRQTLKKNAKGGIRIYSTPTGIREHPYYKLSTGSSEFKTFRRSSRVNPYFTAETERQLIDFYGGKDSPGFQREVEGNHGEAAFGVFDMAAMVSCLIELPDYRIITINGADLIGCNEADIKARITELLSRLVLPDLPIIIGGDLGSASDPTEIVIKAIAGDNTIDVARIHCDSVSYIAQTEIISQLSDRAVQIGLDNGNNGVMVGQALLELDKFQIKRLAEKLIMIDFGGTTETTTPAGVVVKNQNKKMMTDLLCGAITDRRWQIAGRRGADGQLVFADSHKESQFSTQTKTNTQTGRTVYSKGNDHIIDADRCAAYAEWCWWDKNEKSTYHRRPQPSNRYSADILRPNPIVLRGAM